MPPRNFHPDENRPDALIDVGEVPKHERNYLLLDQYHALHLAEAARLKFVNIDSGG
jgi:hypothetical protein